MLSITESFYRLLIACFLGGIIGFERERNHRPAGLRTHLIVCMSSCLAMLISFYILEEYGGHNNIDPSRLSQGIMGGIGFLGAGTIIRDGNKVRGLTTAASIWGVACLGLAIGTGLYEISVLFVTIFMTVLVVVAKLENRYIPASITAGLWITVDVNKDNIVKEINKILEKNNGKTERISIQVEKEDKIIHLSVKIYNSKRYIDIIESISSIKGVIGIDGKTKNNEIE